jgi:hypothetical protein
MQGIFCIIVERGENVSKQKFDSVMIEELRKNPNVKRVSELSITYSEEFKEYFVSENAKGILPTEIFRRCGFDVQKLGEYRIYSSGARWRKAEKRLEGLQDTRANNSGRPLTRELSLEEENQRLRAENEYLKAERELLLELERLEREVKRKQGLSRKKSTK